MARQELRKPIDMLLEEKNKIDAGLTALNDKYNLLQKDLQDARMEQQHIREAKETLSNNNANKPARKLFDDQICVLQRKIEDISNQFSSLEKDRVVLDSKGKAIQKSLSELRNA